MILLGLAANLNQFTAGGAATSMDNPVLLCRLLQDVNIPLRADIPQLFRPYRHADFTQVRFAQQQHEDT